MSSPTPRISPPLRALLATAAALAIAHGLTACQDTFSNPLPLYDAATEDGNGIAIQTEDAGSDASDDDSAVDSGDAATRADAGDGSADGGDGEARDAGEAGPVDGGDASTDADAG